MEIFFANGTKVPTIKWCSRAHIFIASRTWRTEHKISDETEGGSTLSVQWTGKTCSPLWGAFSIDAWPVLPLWDRMTRTGRVQARDIRRALTDTVRISQLFMKTGSDRSPDLPGRRQLLGFLIGTVVYRQSSRISCMMVQEVPPLHWHTTFTVRIPRTWGDPHGWSAEIFLIVNGVSIYWVTVPVTVKYLVLPVTDPLDV
jgi:hypothetical protein